MSQHPEERAERVARCARAMKDGSPRNIGAAWAVHAFTASGVVLALFALLAVVRGDWAECLLWLFAALVVDGVDGTLARAAKVCERLPRIDGDALDLVIDYLTYVLVPALFILRGEYLSPTLSTPLAAGILISSLYTFARRDMKTDDGYFRGFPALWNVIAFYFFVTQPTPPLAAATVAALILMTFAPVYVIHPFRARDYGRWPAALAIVWVISTVSLLRPTVAFPAMLSASMLSAAVLIGMGLVRSVRGPRDA